MFTNYSVNHIVHDYGKKWRFRFNAAKSAVMVFGEGRKVNKANKKDRMFRLGTEGIKEKDNYDHVGVKMSIFPDDTSRVEEKISKGRKTLNASSGMGFRKNGLNMGTCNIIYWQVVMPTVSFGSEVWVLSEGDKELLNSFQTYAGKRIQRFPQRSPNTSSSYGLGWLKITSYIQVKQLLFVRTILKLDPENVIRKIFELRLKVFYDNVEVCRRNRYRSPIFNMLDVAIIFGVLNSIKEMTDGLIPIASKKAWSTLIWDRAWKLEDANWHSTNTILKENDLMCRIIGDTRYLTWWAISDLDYRLVRMCEDMSKIICHASLLKRDDYRLKGLTMSNRTCTNCYAYCVEDIFHVIAQCPYYCNERVLMYDEIFRKCPNVKAIFEKESANVVFYLLGRKIPSICDEEMLCLWCTSGNAISIMYRRAIASRKGIG